MSSRDTSDPQAIELRHHLKPGDIGWVLQCHGHYYFENHGFGLEFESIVSRILTDFATDHDEVRERLWIAEEPSGRRLGSVMLIHEPREDGKASQPWSRLRLFYVDPETQGRGIGNLLIRACLDFSRACGYGGVVLDTVRQLSAARYLYVREGFELVKTYSHNEWGPQVDEEVWRLTF